MLNYIIPPIIIVVSLAFLVVFLFRKADQLEREGGMISQEESFAGKKIKALFAALGQFLLKMLERLMHKSKLFSLKMHNASNKWFHAVREHRTQQLEVIKENNEKEKKEEEEVAREELGEIVFPERMAAQKEKSLAGMNRKEGEVLPRKKETEGKAGDSSRGVVRQLRKKTRNEQLEEVLIKRIAMNPRDMEAYERLGTYYEEAGNIQDALECFKQVSRLSPGYIKARMKIRKFERILLEQQSPLSRR
ncbi:MAG TPA: tetratricopeptide repeat protein [Candidatus Moranbacteria bacterium]|nr:tetratricopeptide repeat protein [Candidatus Moranbacteria bacterium]